MIIPVCHERVNKPREHHQHPLPPYGTMEDIGQAWVDQRMGTTHCSGQYHWICQFTEVRLPSSVVHHVERGKLDKHKCKQQNRI